MRRPKIEAPKRKLVTKNAVMFLMELAVLTASFFIHPLYESTPEDRSLP